MLWCGTGRRVISPTGSTSTSLAGYAARWGKKTGGGIHDDLYAKAPYLKSDSTSVLLLAVDLCEVSDAGRIQQALKSKLDIDHVLVTATHTHSGPYAEESQADPGAFGPAWYGRAVSLMEEAARELADAVKKMLSSARADIEPTLKTHAFSVTLPLRENRPSQEQLNKLVDEAEERINQAANYNIRREAKIRKNLLAKPAGQPQQPRGCRRHRDSHPAYPGWRPGAHLQPHGAVL